MPFAVIARSWTNAALGGEAMNTPACHGEERSDVAIHLKYLLDCRARRPRARNDKRGEFISRSAATKQSSWIATARFAHLAMRRV